MLCIGILQIWKEYSNVAFGQRNKLHDVFRDIGGDARKSAVTIFESLSVTHPRSSRQCYARGLSVVQETDIESVSVKGISCRTCSEIFRSARKCRLGSRVFVNSVDYPQSSRQCYAMEPCLSKEDSLDDVCTKGITCTTCSEIFGGARKCRLCSFNATVFSSISVERPQSSRQCDTMGLRLSKGRILVALSVKGISCRTCSEIFRSARSADSVAVFSSISVERPQSSRQCYAMGLRLSKEDSLDTAGTKGITCTTCSEIFRGPRKCQLNRFPATVFSSIPWTTHSRRDNAV
jgi:hypothetical protein